MAPTTSIIVGSLGYLLRRRAFLLLHPDRSRVLHNLFPAMFPTSLLLFDGKTSLPVSAPVRAWLFVIGWGDCGEGTSRKISTTCPTSTEAIRFVREGPRTRKESMTAACHRRCVVGWRGVAARRNGEHGTRRSSVRPVGTEAKTDKEGEPVKKLTLGSFMELFGFGLGLPMPSDVRVDKKNVKVYLDFEANNFDVQPKYRDEGWVDETESSSDGFWSRLFGNNSKE